MCCLTLVNASLLQGVALTVLNTLEQGDLLLQFFVLSFRIQKSILEIDDGTTRGFDDMGRRRALRREAFAFGPWGLL